MKKLAESFLMVSLSGAAVAQAEAPGTGSFEQERNQAFAALQSAEAAKREDRSVALLLERLAALCHWNGRFTETESFYQCALAMPPCNPTNSRVIGLCEVDACQNHQGCQQ